ncbi:MAG: tRNA (adenosine(37)-N6)-threonylcarbamoyltransferase complex ATPase subunit type 1 TsaE [Succinivibrio sp.]|nr:tRNA (adenosine(37)-N6)-threonylcarbamoyltransferase complex ATPase subunit type 1 TsaE [Succinivibrio sp.]
MSEVTLILENEAKTLALGAALGKSLSPLCLKLGRALLIELRGELGAGKTTLARGLLRALGYAQAVKSPTYALVEPYELSGHEIYHFDLYRLRDPDELEYLGVRDYFARPALCLVEWLEQAQGRLPPPDVVVALSYITSGREAMVQSLLPELPAATCCGELA